MDNAVKVKDHLISLINDASSTNDHHQVIVCVEAVVLPVLLHAEGLWIELNYCYKAQEIAERCRREIEHFLGTCQHHKTLAKLETLKRKLHRVENHFHSLQNTKPEERYMCWEWDLTSLQQEHSQPHYLQTPA